jgi:HK97 gp10 family phage protein
MADARVEFTIDPIKEANKLTKGLRNKCLRIAMNKASAKVKEQVVSKAPKRFGYLQKSIRIKVRQYKTGSVWVSIVGPKSDFRKVRKAKKATRKRKAKNASTHRPALYARFLEKGTKHATARPFLKPAMDATASQYLITLQASIREQVAKLLAA